MNNLLFFTLISMVVVEHTYAMTCTPCQDRQCKAEHVLKRQCIGGLTLDVCGCCKVCAKLEGEKCGDMWGILGTCGEELYCAADSEVINTMDESSFFTGFCRSRVVACYASQPIRVRMMNTFEPDLDIVIEEDLIEPEIWIQPDIWITELEEDTIEPNNWILDYMETISITDTTQSTQTSYTEQPGDFNGGGDTDTTDSTTTAATEQPTTEDSTGSGDTDTTDSTTTAATEQPTTEDSTGSGDTYTTDSTTIAATEQPTTEDSTGSGDTDTTTTTTTEQPTTARLSKWPAAWRGLRSG